MGGQNRGARLRPSLTSEARGAPLTVSDTRQRPIHLPGGLLGWRGHVLASLAHPDLALLPATLNTPGTGMSSHPRAQKCPFYPQMFPLWTKNIPSRCLSGIGAFVPTRPSAWRLRLLTWRVSPPGASFHRKAIPDLPQRPRIYRQDTNQTAFAPGEQSQVH